MRGAEVLANRAEARVKETGTWICIDDHSMIRDMLIGLFWRLGGICLIGKTWEEVGLCFVRRKWEYLYQDQVQYAYKYSWMGSKRLVT